MIPLTVSSVLSDASLSRIRAGPASAPRSTISHMIPDFSAARAIERTYQALDSSAVATTTASFAGAPAAASSAARPVASDRMDAASSLPDSTRALIRRSPPVRRR